MAKTKSLYNVGDRVSYKASGKVARAEELAGTVISGVVKSVDNEAKTITVLPDHRKAKDSVFYNMRTLIPWANVIGKAKTTTKATKQAAAPSIIQLDRASMKALYSKLTNAVAAVGQEYGIALAVPESYSWNQTEGTFKVKATVTGGGKERADAAKTRWQEYAPAWGLKASWFGKTFSRGRGGQYKIIDIRPGATKNCVTVQHVGHKGQYVVTAEHVISGMAK